MKRILRQDLFQRVAKNIGVRNLSASKGPLAATQQNYPANKDLVPAFVNNKNPHNLEKLRIAEKISGWDLEVQEKSFWNKLTIELTGKHITAKILHVFGRTPVSASTNEWCVKKFLYSTKDLVAAKTVGQILAHRCLQMGITEVACFLSEEDRKKDKVALILQALEEGGVALEEPGQVIFDQPLNHFALPEKSWQILEDEEEKLEGAEILREVNNKKKSKKS